MSIATIASSSTTRMRVSGMAGALLPEADREAGAAGAALDRELALELRDEAAHELEAERAGDLVGGKADAVVAHGHAAPAVAAVGQLDADLAARAVGERVLDGVEQQLVDDQAARHGGVDAEQHRVAVDGEADARRIGGEGFEEQLAEGADVVAEVDLGEVRRLVQLPVHERHRADAVLRLGEDLARLGVLDRAG